MKSRWESVRAWLEGAAFGALGGVSTGVWNYFQQNSNYTEVDWANVKQVAVVGAISGLILFWQAQRKEKVALYKLPPDGGARAFLKQAEKEMAESTEDQMDPQSRGLEKR